MGMKALNGYGKKDNEDLGFLDGGGNMCGRGNAAGPVNTNFV